MKRICILLLALLLCLFSLCASAEAARRATAYDFDLRLHLNPDSFPAARIPMMTMTVLNTSEAECTASDTIAPECASRPAASFITDSSRLMPMVI